MKFSHPLFFVVTPFLVAGTLCLALPGAPCAVAAEARDAASSRFAEVAAPTEAAEAAEPTEPAEPTEAAAPAPSQLEAEAFRLSLSVPPVAQRGEPVEFAVELEARGGKKVNGEYPARLALDAGPGWRADQLTWTRGEAKIDANFLVWSGKLVPTTTGPTKLGFRVAFSVCTAEQCLIEKRELSAEVVVR